MKPYYQDSAVTIYHGDCREILPLECDVLLTDPPYGLFVEYTLCNDDPAEVTELVQHVIRLYRRNLQQRIVVTPGQKLMFRYQEPDAVGAFYYPAGVGSSSWGFVGWQPIFYYGKDPFLSDGLGRRLNCFYSTEPSEKNGHPCPKPIKQWTWLVNRVSRPNELILDPFMGSGTTLRAAKDLGRKAIGIEIEEKYCEIAAKRMAQEVLAF